MPFPSTPYLIRPTNIDVRADKILSHSERADLLTRRLHVEEKMDGENLGISKGASGLQFQSRSSFVELGGRQFRGLATWLQPRRARLEAALGENLILFGEWCASFHSVEYKKLPDWFLLFDVYDKSLSRFWFPQDRNSLATHLGLITTPFLAEGHFGLTDLEDMVGVSAFGFERMEGLVARSIERGGKGRAKIVRADFVQQISRHWTSGERKTNWLSSE